MNPCFSLRFAHPSHLAANFQLLFGLPQLEIHLEDGIFDEDFCCMQGQAAFTDVEEDPAVVWTEIQIAKRFDPLPRVAAAIRSVNRVFGVR